MIFALDLIHTWQGYPFLTVRILPAVHPPPILSAALLSAPLTGPFQSRLCVFIASIKPWTSFSASSDGVCERDQVIFHTLPSPSPTAILELFVPHDLNHFYSHCSILEGVSIWGLYMGSPLNFVLMFWTIIISENSHSLLIFFADVNLSSDTLLPGIRFTVIMFLGIN